MSSKQDPRLLVLEYQFDQVQTGLAELSKQWVVEGLTEVLRYQLDSGGKRLRPTLSLWFGEKFGLESNSLLNFSLAVELLHNVFLIHDDIQDGDTFRRGRPTLWVHAGLEDAINAGDFMLSEAYRLICETPADSKCILQLVKLFSSVFGSTVRGQALDLHGRADPSFGLERYEQVIRNKTGRYLACGWVGAAIVAEQTEAVQSTLWKIGDELGPAFQIHDDLLDLTQGKGRGGEIGCDIREGKPSILFAYALESGKLSKAERNRLLQVMSTDRKDVCDKMVAEIITMYQSCGALVFAEREALKRVDQGLQLFARLPFVDDQIAKEFEGLARYLVERKV